MNFTRQGRDLYSPFRREANQGAQQASPFLPVRKARPLIDQVVLPFLVSGNVAKQPFEHMEVHVHQRHAGEEKRATDSISQAAGLAIFGRLAWGLTEPELPDAEVRVMLNSCVRISVATLRVATEVAESIGERTRQRSGKNS